MERSGRDLSTQWVDRASARSGQLQGSLLGWGRRYGAAALGGLLLAAAACLGVPRLRTRCRARRRLREARRGAARPSDATLLYARMLKVLHRRGFQKAVWLTPAEFARQLPVSRTARLVEEFTRAYQELRFGGRREAATRMAALLEEIRRDGRRSAVR